MLTFMGFACFCSVGPERKGQDKAGAAAKVFDVIVNPKVVHVRRAAGWKVAAWLCVC